MGGDECDCAHASVGLGAGSQDQAESYPAALVAFFAGIRLSSLRPHRHLRHQLLTEVVV